MTDKVTDGKNSIIRRIFDNDLTREFARGFMDPDEVLEMKLQEICEQCPVDKENAANVHGKEIERCRREYFALLMQSYVGRAGSDEINRLYGLQQDCENCFRFIGGLASHNPGKPHKKK